MNNFQLTGVNQAFAYVLECRSLAYNADSTPQLDTACYRQSCQLASNSKWQHQHGVCHVPSDLI